MKLVKVRPDEVVEVEFARIGDLWVANGKGVRGQGSTMLEALKDGLKDVRKAETASSGDTVDEPQKEAGVSGQG